MNNEIEKIVKAMENRKSISGYYDGKFRKLSPYEIGYKNDEIQCLFYQYSGESKKSYINGKSKYNWRCLKIKKLSKIQILDEILHKPDIITHKRPSFCVDRIIKRILID